MFKSIPGYEGLYETNEKGVVRSLDRVINGKKIKGQIIKPMVSLYRNHEYLRVILWNSRKRKALYIHKALKEIHGVSAKPSDLIDAINGLERYETSEEADARMLKLDNSFLKDNLQTRKKEVKFYRNMCIAFAILSLALLVIR